MSLCLDTLLALLLGGRISLARLGLCAADSSQGASTQVSSRPPAGPTSTFLEQKQDIPIRGKQCPASAPSTRKACQNVAASSQHET